MSNEAETSGRAFQYLVRVLEDAIKVGADVVGLEREELDLMVVNYFKSVGRAEGFIPQDLQQAVVEEIVKRAELADKARGKMQIRLLGKDHEVVVDERSNWGESGFTLTLKRSERTAFKAPFQGRHVVPESKGDLVEDAYRGPLAPSIRQEVGRNDPCPCGSGKKYKKCCWNKQRNEDALD